MGIGDLDARAANRDGAGEVGRLSFVALNQIEFGILDIRAREIRESTGIDIGVIAHIDARWHGGYFVCLVVWREFRADDLEGRRGFARRRLHCRLVLT